MREYSKAMKGGETFPPIVVYYDQKAGKYWLADGFHRCAAAEDASYTEIEADIREGTRRDALLFATGANSDHGVRRTNEDKRKAVITHLTDDEWQQWSDHEVAKRTRTTQPFVSKLRRLIGSDTLRLGANGRIINTAKIGKPKISSLEQAWKNADEEKRQQWVKEHRNELQDILR